MFRSKISKNSLNRQNIIIGFVAAIMAFSVVYTFTDFASEPYQEKTDTKVAVVVLDASDWKPINDLREKERLPEIDSIIEEEGVHGDLHAPSAFSPVEWTTVATGVHQDELSIEGWNTQEDGQQRMVRQEDVEHKRIWNYLNEGNYSTGVVSWLLTWPVEDEVDGFMISGPMRTGDYDFVHPQGEFNIKEEEVVLDGQEWNEAQMGIDRKEDVDFLALGLKNLDVIQHHLWKFVDPEPFGKEKEDEHEEYREIVYTEYENLDETLEKFDEDWNVLVFGTSGFRPENEARGWIGPSYAQELNSLIEWLDYGEFETRTTRGTQIEEPQPGTDIERCPLNHQEFGGDVVNETTQRFQLCVLEEDANIGQIKEDLKSVQYRDGRTLISDLEYYGDRDVIIVEKRIYEDGIVEEEFKMAPTDQPLVDGDMPYIDVALGIELPNGTEKKLWIGPEKNGDHPPGTDSIFLARGPDIKEGYELPEGAAHTYDIAPTVLYMYGLPVPENMEGEPVKEIFKESFVDERELVYTSDSTYREEEYNPEKRDIDQEEALKQRLRDVGYLIN